MLLESEETRSILGGTPNESVGDFSPLRNEEAPTALTMPLARLKKGSRVSLY